MKFLPRALLDAGPITANFLTKLFFQHRLILSFIKRDLATRYLGSILGVLWAVIHPLVLLISYTFIFTVLFRPGEPGGRYSENFVLYLFAGLLPWLYFQDTVQRSATTLRPAPTRQSQATQSRLPQIPELAGSSQSLIRS